MADDDRNKLLSVALSSSGLELVLEHLTERVDGLESRNKAQERRLEALKETSPEIDVSPSLCDTSELDSLSTSAPEQQLAAMAGAIVSMGQSMNQFYKDVKYREAVQQATDAAQDEIMIMELDRLGRELELKFTHKDASNMRKMIASEMRTMREEMEQDFAARLSDIDGKVSVHLSRVMEQVRAIQDSTHSTNDLLQHRIQEAFSDIQSASSDMDTKIRKIATMFGVTTNAEGDETNQFEEMASAVEELRRNADAIRIEIDGQEATAAELANRMNDVQVAIGHQMDALTETVNQEVGNGVGKIVADLQASLETLEQKMEGKVAEQLDDCTKRLQELSEQVGDKEAAAEGTRLKDMSEYFVVAGVQDDFLERAKAHEEQLQHAHDDFRAAVEEGVERRFGKVSDQMFHIEELIEEAKSSGISSADQLKTLGSTASALTRQLSDLQATTAAKTSQMEAKISEGTRGAEHKSDQLEEELKQLVVIVRNNQNELDSHVQSSRAFLHMTSDHQRAWTATSKALAGDLDSFKSANGDRMSALERSNVSAVTTMRSLQRAVDALATKEGRWERLEVQAKRHVQVLGGQLAELEGEATYGEAFSLAPAMQKHLSAVSQMVAKIIATRADYEVTRQALRRKDPAEEGNWDEKLEALRSRNLDKFVGDVVEVAARLRPLPDRPVKEVREAFAKKLGLTMKLAISKYRPIQAGATILGKMPLQPACMACDRPFKDNPGPGDQRSVLEDQRLKLRDPIGGRGGGRSRSVSPSVRGEGSPGGGGFPVKGQWTAGGTPAPKYPVAVFGDDDASVASVASVFSKDSQASSSTRPQHRSRSDKARSPQKYVMRAGFKMRQSHSEGSGLVANARPTGGPEAGLRAAFGVAKSSSANSLVIPAPGGPHAGGDAACEADGGLDREGEQERGTRHRSEGPSDHIDGSPLDLRPCAMTAQGTRGQDRSTRAVAFAEDDDDVARGGIRRTSVITPTDAEEAMGFPLADDAPGEDVAVHLPVLR